MKNLLFVIIIAASMGCSNKKESPNLLNKIMGDTIVLPQYHVRVQCWRGFRDNDGEQYYIAEYTDDNWRTVSRIPDCLETVIGPMQMDLVSTNKQELVLTAKKITNIERMNMYKDSVNSLYAYRKKQYDEADKDAKSTNKKIESLRQKANESCCKIINVY